MQYGAYINYRKITEWGITVNQAVLFQFIYELPSWADTAQFDGKIYCRITKNKISEELPFIGASIRSIHRQIASLEDAGVVDRRQTGNVAWIRVTEKGASWNRTNASDGHHHDKSGSHHHDKSGSHDHDKSGALSVHQLSENQSSVKTYGTSADADDTERDDGQPKNSRHGYPYEFEQAWQAYPKRDGPNNKRQAFKAWQARIRSGVPAKELHAGVKRYAAYAQAQGQIGTRFVRQAATFFGPNEHYADDYPDTPPEKPNGPCAEPAWAGAR